MWGKGVVPVFYNTGHGHLGWTLSAATAQTAAEPSESHAGGEAYCCLSSQSMRPTAGDRDAARGMRSRSDVDAQLIGGF